MTILSLLAMLIASSHATLPNCARALWPREIDAPLAFENLVDWVEDELIVRRRAPGLVVGVSGTDSIVAFLAAAEAFARAGRPARAVAMHFGAADGHGWFQETILPWLRERAPAARILVDASIDHRRDGLRWGALLDWSVLSDPTTGALRPPSERYWVVGTRNRSEALLGTYSNLSRAASVQPLTSLWKSEILQICESLEVPAVALDQSCAADCTCGREQFPALHIPEVDALLMERVHELESGWAREVIGAKLYDRLDEYVTSQIESSRFKGAPPYQLDFDPPRAPTSRSSDEFGDVRAAMTDPEFTGRELASVVPRIVTEGRANVAASLVLTPATNVERWLGEAMVLMNTPGLRPIQRRRMLERIYDAENLSTPEVVRLARVTARLANYGYSFARWRFLFKGFDNQPSLAERWGFRSVARERSHGLGAGFALERGEWSVEFRQAYVVVTLADPDAPITLLIRNNSTVFGRDQTDAAAYVAWVSLTPAERHEITAENLRLDRRAVVFSDFLKTRPDLSRSDKIERVTEALNFLRALEEELDRWLTGPVGFPALRETLRSAAAEYPVWIGFTEAEKPSWFPRGVRAVTPELLAEMARTGPPKAPGGDAGRAIRLTLLSGANGDFP